MERLADLDELILRCRTDQAKSYIAESVMAYRAGAYRACIVHTWIAVVFDVIDKIRELAISGDGKARTALSEFETTQKQIDRGDHNALEKALRFERNILDVARNDFELIDQQQFVDLDRLRQDRNRCAHPTFQRIETPYHPTAELARTHLRSAIVHLLQEAPVQGKAALTELQALVESKYFPVEPEKAAIQLRASAFARPNEALVRNFVDLLIFGAFESNNPLRFQRRTLAALQACLNLQRNVAETRIRLQINKIIRRLGDADVHAMVSSVRWVPELWEMLEESGREKLRQFILTGPAEQVNSVIHQTSQIAGLKDAARVRLRKASAVELAAAIKKDIGELALERAIELYTSVGSWIDANQQADSLILPLLGKMKRSHIESIVEAARTRKADLIGSNGFSLLIEKIPQEGVLTTAELDETLKNAGLEGYTSGKKSKAIDLDDIPF